MERDELWLRSELSELNAILAEIPEDDPLERLSFEERRAKVQAELKKLARAVPPEHFTLTFGGRSVRCPENRPARCQGGIDAAFAAEALAAFCAAFAAVSRAVQMSPKDGEPPVPGRDRLVLTIAHPPVFELELPATAAAAQADLSADPVRLACRLLEDILKGALEGDEARLAPALTAIGRHACGPLALFLERLHSAGAEFTLETAHCRLECRDRERLGRAAARLAQSPRQELVR
ncbi:MAG: hypothetical protein Q4F72_11415 [Desulfovibrionaceae bacterium]|nr:hypothetical protein [Desulfovibrionaceae bacterium]